MAPALTVYIDEAGDPGVRDGLRYLSDRHEWLCVSALIVRSSREAQVVEWVKELREAANSRQAGALHYHRINAGRRHRVCETLATKPVRAFVVASHKSNVREYINPRVRAMLDAGTFYNWCLRLLLERVTAWSEARMKTDGVELGPLNVVFARRGHDYEHFFKYVDRLRQQKETGTLFLKGPGLAPPLLDRANWSIRPADAVAGLQLADVVASSFYQAANSASPTWDIAPAQCLAPVIPDRHGVAANVGVTVWPLPNQAGIPDDAKGIFRHYGYRM